MQGGSRACHLTPVHTPRHFSISFVLALTYMHLFLPLSRESLLTFIRYSAWSIGLFIPEYVLFLLLVAYTPFHYVTITVGTFIFGITLQYAVVRHFVFSHTLRKWHSGFVLFATSATVGAGLVVLLMVVFVEILSIPQYIARVLAGAIAGYLVYLFNLYATFTQPHGVCAPTPDLQK